jgi:hypothetical protein
MEVEQDQVLEFLPQQVEGQQQQTHQTSWGRAVLLARAT